MGWRPGENVEVSITEHIIGMVERLKEPLGLNGWTIKVDAGTLDDGRAACDAWPEYKHAVLTFDLEKLETGDELDELIVHEMMHPLTWPIHKEAEDLADLAANMLPESAREPMRIKFQEEVRQAGEDANTQVGFIAIRLLRRLWAAEEAVNEARAEIKSLKKQLKQVESVVK